MYCIKCGTQLPDDANFCNHCGVTINEINQPPIKATEEVLEKLEDQSCNQVVSFVKNILYYIIKAPLIVSGSLMNLVAWPFYLWFVWGVYEGDSYYQLLVDSAEYHGDERFYKEIQALDQAILASDALKLLGVIGLLVLVVGIVLYVLEKKGVILSSKLRGIFLFLLPVVITIIVAVYVYPPIWNYIYEYWWSPSTFIVK